MAAAAVLGLGIRFQPVLEDWQEVGLGLARLAWQDLPAFQVVEVVGEVGLQTDQQCPTGGRAALALSSSAGTPRRPSPLSRRD